MQQAFILNSCPSCLLRLCLTPPRDASAAIWTHPHHTTFLNQPSCSSQGGSGLATHTHLGGGSGSGASPTGSHSSGSGGDASYMAATTSVRRRPVKRGSSLRDDAAFSSSSGRPRSHHAGGGGGGGNKRVPITRTSFSLRYLGSNVEVYWPDDNTWWAATVLQVRGGPGWLGQAGVQPAAWGMRRRAAADMQGLGVSWCCAGGLQKQGILSNHPGRAPLAHSRPPCAVHMLWCGRRLLC